MSLLVSHEAVRKVTALKATVFPVGSSGGQQIQKERQLTFSDTVQFVGCQRDSKQACIADGAQFLLG